MSRASDRLTVAGLTARSWRALLVTVHVVSAVCWLGLAVALIVLLALCLSSPPGEIKVAAAVMANELDLTVLGFSAMIAALSGFALSTATPWGWFHHRWVAAKAVLTLAQILVGTVILGRALPGIVVDVRAGSDGAAWPVILGLGLVVSGLTLQVWLSVAKPGGRTRYGRRSSSRPPTAPAATFAMMVLLPLVDTALHAWGAVDLPVLTALGLVAALLLRRRTRLGQRPRGAPRDLTAAEG